MKIFGYSPDEIYNICRRSSDYERFCPLHIKLPVLTGINILDFTTGECPDVGCDCALISTNWAHDLAPNYPDAKFFEVVNIDYKDARVAQFVVSHYYKKEKYPEDHMVETQTIVDLNHTFICDEVRSYIENT